MTRDNVIVFGECGAGKSSVINMLAGYNAADTSSKVTGCTLESDCYCVNIRGSPFYLHDTAGLNEGDQGRVPKNEAIVQLFTLIKKLEDGVSLLVFVMRGRIKESTVSNWRLFQEVICKSQVPTVIVITGLEGEDDMDDWWFNNKEAFRGYGIRPDGHACITATRGRRRPSGVFALQEEYDESKHKVERLIRSTFLQSPWKMDNITWFTKILTTEVVLFRLFFWKLWTTTRKIGEIRGAVNDLVDRCGMSRGDAEALAKLLEAAN